ncbi:hypothetical protein DL764_005423 [Monosporascus ibericus]|uniref:C2H2-type domain-containing protein n=1 Tax=Monosporascus ibericus TaxID=155417 RepID=A0A4Q4TBX6_9PEZI|nr:hypothetical protein DL764_005423 [Monosporascus ibericus]
MDRYPDNDCFALNDDAILVRLLDPQQLSGPSTMTPGWSPDVTTSNCPINLAEFNGQQTVDMEAGGALCLVWLVHVVRPSSRFRRSPLPFKQHTGRVGHLTPFAFVKCFTAFWNNSELLRHGKDTDHHPYACHGGKDFSRLDSLKRHLNSRAAGSETCKSKAKHSCTFCTKYDGEKGFDRRDHLLQHLRGRHHFEENGIAFMKVRAGRTATAPAQAVSNAVDAVAQNVPVPPID